ncbi:hypothetical protein [Minwuia sp.]|uniref:hypothetical protein n=1 Tax=Minwuia sp. TaxID=2493630 RepID=UPI003A93C68A
MTDTTEKTAKGEGPIKRITSESLAVKIWKQPGVENKPPFLTITIGSLYRDKETGKILESSSLTVSQMQKLPMMLNEANLFVSQWKARQKDARQQQGHEAPTKAEATPNTGLTAQRDAVMAEAVVDTPARAPEHSPTLDQ